METRASPARRGRTPPASSGGRGAHGHGAVTAPRTTRPAVARVVPGDALPPHAGLGQPGAPLQPAPQRLHPQAEPAREATATGAGIVGAAQALPEPDRGTTFVRAIGETVFTARRITTVGELPRPARSVFLISETADMTGPYRRLPETDAGQPFTGIVGLSEGSPVYIAEVPAGFTERIMNCFRQQRVSPVAAAFAFIVVMLTAIAGTAVAVLRSTSPAELYDNAGFSAAIVGAAAYIYKELLELVKTVVKSSKELPPSIDRSGRPHAFWTSKLFYPFIFVIMLLVATACTVAYCVRPSQPSLSESDTTFNRGLAGVGIMTASTFFLKEGLGALQKIIQSKLESRESTQAAAAVFPCPIFVMRCCPKCTSPTFFFASFFLVFLFVNVGVSAWVLRPESLATTSPAKIGVILAVISAYVSVAKDGCDMLESAANDAFGRRQAGAPEAAPTVGGNRNMAIQIAAAGGAAHLATATGR